MGRAVNRMRKIAALLLLVCVLGVLFGCVNDEQPPAQNDEISSGEENDAGSDEVQDPSDENKTPSDDSLLIPDEEQTDASGFPNPPEDGATKRY